MSRKSAAKYDLSEILQHTRPAENLRVFRYLAYIILGWFSMTLEVFLRRSFGERYLTRSNYLVGFSVISIFTFFGKVSFSIFTFRFGGGMFFYLWYCYLVLGMVHFTRMWMSDKIGSSPHTLYSGTSYLEPVTKLLLKVLNPLLARLFRWGGVFVLSRESFEKLGKSLQLSTVIYDKEAFTKRFTEPLVVFLFAFYFTSGSLYTWLIVCGMALLMHSHMDYEYEREEYLDIKDSMIDAIRQRDHIQYREKLKHQLGGMMEDIQKRAEAEPEFYEELKVNSPSVAEVLAAMKAENTAA